MPLAKLILPLKGKLARKKERDISCSSEHKHNQTSQLCDLPAEMIDLIASFLERHDLCMLRLTCSALRSTSKYQFGRIGLHTLRTDLSKANMSAMAELANACGYNHHVKRLYICGSSGCYLGYGFSWIRDFWSNRYLIWLLTSEGFLRLRALLEKFPNCQSFHVSLSEEPEEGAWKDCISPSDAIVVLLNLMSCMARPVKSFTCSHSDPKEQLPGIISSKNFSSRHFDDARLSITLSTLTELAILAYIKNDALANFVCNFASQASNLKKLELDFAAGSGAPTVMQQLGSGSSLVKLEELKLSNALGISGHDLYKVLLENCASLRILSLKVICLDDELWETILDSLMRDFPVLEEMTLLWIADRVSGLRELYPGSMYIEGFQDLRGRHGPIRVFYAGPPVHEALSSLLQRYRIPAQQTSRLAAQWPSSRPMI
ncbi:uncharacterized protein BO97DRAFT_465035 [Aspergillus homomorphus CBS 101889]|uniref:F-box domain-containing protein n=1 Tax=Aspergillus homomorphus (strain CBS 101889) TaxID=1450537 RepID=A0A395I3K6_ASPHC|nr:hypothetical protein BO97DRAFT_465035 [Aspergillus homomorphus CBS 101889]RAL14537.1 hypothetical protein BO97DRAFT_465035 [Aspergillus homomorphus CBS 101889]